MILLKGESSAGKSTIFQGIFWCLYRSMKNVSNDTGITKQCSVTLQIDQMVIYRQKKPKLLLLSLVNDTGQIEYKDDIAQQIINQKFGTKELWKSCSYIVQKERCDLLKGSLSERLALLNQLSFDQDNPKDYIFKIDQELKFLNKEFTEFQAAFTAELNMFSQQLATKPVTTVINPDGMTELENKITLTTSEIEKLYNEVLEHERNLGSYNTLTNQINSIQSRLNNTVLTVFNEEGYFRRVNELNENIQFMKNGMNNLNNYNTIKNQINTLEDRRKYYEAQLINIRTNIANINNQIVINLDLSINVNEQLLWNVTQLENSLSKNIKLAQDLGCEYNQVSITNMMNELREKINENRNMEKNMKLYSQLKLLKQQLSQYSVHNSLVDYENKKHSLALEISELKKGLELLQCPECTKPLRYLNNKLIPGERDPVSPNQIFEKESEYQILLNEINTCKTVNMLKDQIKNLEEQLFNINLTNLETYQPINIKNLENSLAILGRIEILQPLEYSSDVIRKVLENNKLKQTLLNYQNQEIEINNQLSNINHGLNNLKLPDAPSFVGNIKEYENELIKINRDYQMYLANKQSYEELNKSLTILSEQRNLIILNYSSGERYNDSKKLLTELKKKYEDANYGNGMIKRQTELNVKRDKVINLNEELTSLQRLKQNAIEIECKQLQDTVDTINSALSDILPLFFKKCDISMKFQLYKTLKTTKEVKPGLNICIKKGGVEYDNINDLSGGEGDRISLAVVLALNSVSNSPFILLDECISSLDGAIKEDCVEAIRTIEGKTIICIDHEGVEGFYDRTITASH